jgi:hypothetical protein
VQFDRSLDRPAPAVDLVEVIRAADFVDVCSFDEVERFVFADADGTIPLPQSVRYVTARKPAPAEAAVACSRRADGRVRSSV